MGFRYYDPLFQIVMDLIEDERKEYFHTKNREKYLLKKVHVI